MKVLQKTLIEFATDLKLLDKVLSWFEQLRPSSVPHKDWLQCELALAEGFTNAVRHAHRDLPKDVQIKVEVTLYSGSIEIRIWDCGPPFDLQGHLENSEKQRDNTLAGGGRGIGILQKISDHLSYDRVDENHNCLLIIKHYVPRQPEQV